eukprot:CAMPEP_0196596998 /NCGR_PEP_ID=MMETSP1081-20130531/89014_1 /TAXON_ID=36882 /ORGANISM="Pyramimonas amylifera, Strain CCMP720" /LENGTH=43 /DNA_ID= /DNA_START= /DNA_END= /DNA_ORIENTATION=
MEAPVALAMKTERFCTTYSATHPNHLKGEGESTPSSPLHLDSP